MVSCRRFRAEDQAADRSWHLQEKLAAPTNVRFEYDANHVNNVLWDPVPGATGDHVEIPRLYSVDEACCRATVIIPDGLTVTVTAIDANGVRGRPTQVVYHHP